MTRGLERGQGRVFRRGPRWWIAYSRRGQEYRESSKSANRADALRLLRGRLGELGIGRFVGPAADRVTVADLLDLVEADYELKQRRSLRRLRTACVHLVEEFGPDLALDVTLARLEDYVTRRRRDGAALASIQYELATLRRGFTLAMRRQLLAFRPPFPTLLIDNARQGFFEREGLEQVRAALPEPLRNVVTFAYLTGWRVPSEVLRLTWDRVDFSAGVVRLDVRTTKNGAGRTFPFDVLPELKDVLERQQGYSKNFEAVNGQPIPWVFHRAGRPIRDFYHRVAESVSRHRPGRPDPARLPAHGRAEPAAGGRPGVLGDAAHRAQDAGHLPALCDHQRGGPPRGGDAPRRAAQRAEGGHSVTSQRSPSDASPSKLGAERGIRSGAHA